MVLRVKVTMPQNRDPSVGLDVVHLFKFVSRVRIRLWNRVGIKLGGFVRVTSEYERVGASRDDEVDVLVEAQQLRDLLPYQANAAKALNLHANAAKALNLAKGEALGLSFGVWR